MTFRPGEDPLVAAAVVPVPKIDEGLSTFEGLVVSVDERELVVDGDGGPRTFDISGAGEGAFDILHLEEHAEEEAPIKVYFDPSSPDVGVTYEDA